MPPTGRKIVRPEDFGWTWGRAKPSSSSPPSKDLSNPLQHDAYWWLDQDSLQNASGTQRLQSGLTSAVSECRESLGQFNNAYARLQQTLTSTPSAETTSSGSSSCILTSKPSVRSAHFLGIVSSSMKVKALSPPPRLDLSQCAGSAASYPAATSPRVPSCRTATVTFGIRCISLMVERGWARLKRLFSQPTSTRR